MKPIRMDFKTNDNVCNTMALAVYAPYEYLAEVKGAHIRITHHKALHSLGLDKGKFYGAKAIARPKRTQNVILANHNNKLSNISNIFIRVEATDWSRQVTTEECREILVTSYNDSNNIKTINLFQASTKEEYGATDTHISYYINKTDATIINITTPTNKQIAVSEATSSLENSHCRCTFAHSSLVTALPHHGRVDLYTVDSKNERTKFLRQNQAAKLPFANKQHPKPNTHNTNGKAGKSNKQ